MAKKAGSIDSIIRFDEKFHAEFTQFLLKLGAATGKKQTIRGFAMEAIKEKMTREMKEYNITLQVYTRENP